MTPTPPAPPPPPVLPRELESILLRAFPPGYPMAGGFEYRLIDAMANADPINLLRLFKGFPVVGCAFQLWAAGAVTIARPEGQRPTVTLGDELLSRVALAFRYETWALRCEALRVALDGQRTRDADGRQILQERLAAWPEFGA